MAGLRLLLFLRTKMDPAFIFVIQLGTTILVGSLVFLVTQIFPKPSHFLHGKSSNMLPSILPIPVFLLFTFIFVLSAVLLLQKKNRDDQKQPPGPPPLPLIGNLHILGALPHRTLQSLAKIYGPIMSLRLGQVPTVVVSSPEAAELFLKTHDTVFASRPRTQASDYLSYGSKGLAFSAYGAYWRSMRKLCASQLLSASNVGLFSSQRGEELGQLVKSLEKAAAAGKVVDLSEMVAKFVEDIMYKMIFGPEMDNGFDLKRLIHEAFTLLGAFNAADYVPWLGAFDLQGLTQRLKKNSKAIDEVLELIIEEREQDPSGHKRESKDFVGILLSFMNQHLDDEHNHLIDRTNVKAILLDMIAGAFEAPAIVVDWAFSELLRHPRVLKNLQDELEDKVGLSKMVEEADLSRLNYLDMAVKETLRLYPIAPLLVPRVSSENITINGYFIKRNSRIIVNAWAIGRDPKVWSDNAEVFYPERFIDNEIDLQGHDFQLIPFGSGRRGCPGLQLGLTTVKFILAQLVHCFTWELPSGMTPNDVDMSEKFGLSMPRACHLMAMPTYRLLK